jgi:DNA-binding NarL/FixJ family response regulator
MSERIRVLLVDDQQLVRTGFRRIVADEPDIEVVGEAADGRAAVEAADRLRPDVIVMDIRMPVMDGIEATRRLCAAGP